MTKAKPKRDEAKAHYDRIMAARDQQELIYLDQLKTAWQERDEARQIARELLEDADADDWDEHRMQKCYPWLKEKKPT